VADIISVITGPHLLQRTGACIHYRMRPFCGRVAVRKCTLQVKAPASRYKCARLTAYGRANLRRGILVPGAAKCNWRRYLSPMITPQRLLPIVAFQHTNDGRVRYHKVRSNHLRMLSCGKAMVVYASVGAGTSQKLLHECFV
jgi:hypothetical protein